jgi:hypothetical protein
MDAVRENNPIDRAPTTKTFIQLEDFMFAPFQLQRLNIPHQAGSLSSSFRVILAEEGKIIRLGEWFLVRAMLVRE